MGESIINLHYNGKEHSTREHTIGEAKTMRNYPDIGIQVGGILLPGNGVDQHKWAVIACDQYTSQPEYWQKVQNIIGDAPSTYNMILPEVLLGTPAETDRIRTTQAAMRKCLDDHLLVPSDGLILVEREVGGKTRHGLMLALDLEQYDFHQGSQSLIRATEGTIIERLPPRIRIRDGAPLELPHILVLIDDPERTVIEPLVKEKESLTKLYDTDLMLGSGHLRGYEVRKQGDEAHVVEGLRRLANPTRFQSKYGVGPEKGVLLFAVGDGNHSLATAKSIWEQVKNQAGMDHPARYALVEVENVHDEGLRFEPIHRALFDVRGDWQSAMKEAFGDRLQIHPMTDTGAMIDKVGHQSEEQSFGVIHANGAWTVTVREPSSNLPMGTLQQFLDAWMKANGARQIDYVHGDEVICELGQRPGNLGFYLPAMDKGELFKTVILDGSLPRKTFSMGEAHEKRFYMESRSIQV